MHYVITAHKSMLEVYPIPTEERAKMLAHCMSGYWRYKNVQVLSEIPKEKWLAEGKMWTIHNQGYNAGTIEGRLSEAENFYCIPRAINWKVGMKRCV